MRTVTVFFAGAATVVVALAVGLGGGLLIANIVSPHAAKQAADTGKPERRSTETIGASSRPSEPSPYIVATQDAATKPVVVEPAPQARPQQPEQANATPPAEAAPVSREAVRTVPPVVVTQPTQETAASSPDEASAKAREARRVEEKRKAERRQQMAERRRVQPRQDDELRNVEQKVREQTEAPRAEQARAEMPRFNLFGNNE